MYLETDKDTCEEIQKIIDQQSEKPGNVRIFIAGMG